MSLKISLPNLKSPICPISRPNQQQGTAFRRSSRISGFYAATAESLYQVLGVEKSGSSVSDSDIKRAYKQMALKYHPDVAPPERVDEHTRRFIMVREAYDTLSNPQKRALYDRDLYHRLNLESEEKVEWRRRWEAQLHELQKRSNNRPSRMGRRKYY